MFSVLIFTIVQKHFFRILFYFNLFIHVTYQSQFSLSPLLLLPILLTDYHLSNPQRESTKPVTLSSGKTKPLPGASKLNKTFHQREQGPKSQLMYEE